jgi:hypothetical protein
MPNTEGVPLNNIDPTLQSGGFKRKETLRDIRKREKRVIESRDDWKEKHKQRANEIKELRDNLDDVKQRRDAWRKKYEENRSTVQELQKALAKQSKQLKIEIEEKQKNLEISKELLNELNIEKKKRGNNHP